MNKTNILVFLTSSYPNANGETFIENEIHYLEKIFEKIIIFCSSPITDYTNKYTPANAIVFYIDCNLINLSDKIKSLMFLFNNNFWVELINIKMKLNSKTYIGIIKTLLIEQYKAYKVSRIIKKEISDLKIENNFFFYSYWLNYTALAIINLKTKYPAAKFFSRSHGWDLYYERGENNYLPLRNYICKNLDVIFTISKHGENYIKNNYRLSLKNYTKIITSRLGTNYYGNTLFNKPKNNQLIIVSCSMIYPNKQIDLLAKTLINLKQDFLIKWYHFGTFISNFSESYYDELLTIKQNNKNELLQINFMGYVSNQEIMAFYLNNPVDILINVSLSEGIPVSIMEAMSCGIPVIASNVGGTSEILKNGVNGYLLSSNPSEEEISYSLMKFCKLSESEKSLMKENAKKEWDENYNANKNYLTFVNQILSI